MTETLPPFSGDKKSFWKYRIHYLDLAARSSTVCEFGHGLRGFILSPLEWLGLPFPTGHVAAAFVPVHCSSPYLDKALMLHSG